MENSLIDPPTDKHGEEIADRLQELAGYIADLRHAVRTYTDTEKIEDVCSDVTRAAEKAEFTDRYQVTFDLIQTAILKQLQRPMTRHDRIAARLMVGVLEQIVELESEKC